MSTTQAQAGTIDAQGPAVRRQAASRSLPDGECGPEAAAYAIVTALARKFGDHEDVFADALHDLREQLQDCLDDDRVLGREGEPLDWSDAARGAQLRHIAYPSPKPKAGDAR